MGTGGSSLPSSPLWLYILCFHSIHTFLLRKIYNYIAISYKRLLLFFFEPRKNHRNFCEKFSCTLSLFKRSSPRPISIGQLLHYCIYTSDLSTLLSARGLQGYLILKRVSRLDAFSVYLNRTPLPCHAAGATTGAQLVRSSRSSRTKDKPSQVSYAHDG